MQAFNSCTKYLGIINDHMPNPTRFPGHGCDHRSPISQHSFDSQATGVISVLGLSWHVINDNLYNVALADVRSTVAVIKCLYCSIVMYPYHIRAKSNAQFPKSLVALLHAPIRSCCVVTTPMTIEQTIGTGPAFSLDPILLITPYLKVWSGLRYLPEVI